ncbi:MULTISPECIES: NADH-quinone oxidoreductase subunit NuoH [Geobacter]|uniref:NADH-quinone oxidoreductase subunit H n=2 Tax=Geobacter TaxID=28231 RepID=A0A0C1R0L2_9BACT|nr:MULTISPECIES: NADH-quinone oxidoreductase subunit NuoH [Geobacter]ANA39282.1 NADH-quinone oxidoreductase [Geobacter anodireducens]KIE44021.1 NADH-quinone oxidoreductase [Geobacter soli]MBE2886523.1 NADH-quinone oxidoreductase subunit NuoH [Geobacter anodireducens]HMN03151.1 NADH-quinone oxidoreductase subunit NuoH [Geobacter anodireducens]
MGYELFGLPMIYYVSMVAKVLVVFVFVLLTVAYATYAERKIIGHMQVRLGPMRTGWHGLLQPIADGLKLFFKEEIVPSQSDKFAFLIAPIISLVPAFIGYAVIPFGETIEVAGYKIPLQIAGYYDTASGQVVDMNVGVLYILALASMGVYGIVLAGWSSNSKYSLLGGLRASAQMISYELAAGLAIISVFMLSESLSLQKIVADQANGAWYCFKQPLAFILFFICSLAEINRTPFDLPEAETELVSGYCTEYSSMKYAMFFMAEYANMVTVCAVTTTLFLGGWHGPAFLPGWVWFIAKVYFLIFVCMWIRATYPRYRYDQLMRLGWKVFLPLTLVNIIVTGIVVSLQS